MTDPGKPVITNLAALAAALERSAPAPVEQWSPPYCGDIGLAILSDGTWTYGGSPIRRDALIKLFARVLRRDDDGRHYLVTPAEKIDIAVSDAPFLAVEMQADGSGDSQRITFRTNVDDIVICGPPHPLRFAQEAGSEGLKPYLHIRGRLEALVSRALVYDLAELAVPRYPAEPDRLGVWSSGMWFELTPAD